MKAAVFEKIGHLSVHEVPDPILEAGSVIIRVRACSICGTDLRIYRNGHPRVEPPQILGHEIAGEVVSIADDVHRHAIGDRVAVTPTVACGECFYCRRGQPIYCQNRRTFGYQLSGGYAEYLFIPSFAVAYGVLNDFPQGTSFEMASLAEPLACCIRAQRKCSVSHGDTVVVIGGGPIGLMHCRLAKANRAGRVILLEREAGRLRQVDLSAIDEVVSSANGDAEEHVKKLTGGRGSDVVIIACSSAEAQRQSLHLAGHGGRVDFFGGLPTGQSDILIDSNIIHYREVSLFGAHGSTPADNRDALDLIISRSVKVDDLITHRFPLDAIEEAFQLAESRSGMHVTVCP